MKMLFLLHYICIGYFQEYQSVWLISSWKLKHVDQQSHVRALKAEATILVNQLEQWKNKNKIIILSKSKMPPIVKIVFFHKTTTWFWGFLPFVWYNKEIKRRRKDKTEEWQVHKPLSLLETIWLKGQWDLPLQSSSFKSVLKSSLLV